MLVDPVQVGDVLSGELLEVQLGQIVIRELGRPVTILGLRLELGRQVEPLLHHLALLPDALELDYVIVGDGARGAEPRRGDPM